MKRLLTLYIVGAAIATPVLAQSTPAQTNLDPKAAAKEQRNARGAQLTSVTPEQALHNELQRCANLPPSYKADCESRVHGKGLKSGSVVGGGILEETVTPGSAAKAPAGASSK